MCVVLCDTACVKNDYRRDRRQVSLVVDNELWFLVKRSAAAEGLSVTAWVTALLEEGVHVGDGVGRAGGGGVGAEGFVSAAFGGRGGDGDLVGGVVGRRGGVEHVPDWAVPIVAARGDASIDSGTSQEVDPLEEIA